MPRAKSTPRPDARPPADGEAGTRPVGNGGPVKQTPLMRQYEEIKRKHPGALLLFRVGDFYETFGEDAIAAAKALSITLTRRANGAASEVELAGFPHHALDQYLPRLVRAGHRVAVCDQLEDPRQALGIVKRGVTELVTPGVTLHEATLEAGRGNYLAAVYVAPPGTRGEGPQYGLALLEASTGEFIAGQGSGGFIERQLEAYRPAEVIASKAARHHLADTFGSLRAPYYLDDWIIEPGFGRDLLLRHFETPSLKGYGLEEYPAAVAAAGAALHYLQEARGARLPHITGLSRLDGQGQMWLDRFTIRNLELTDGLAEGSRTLAQVMDRTATPMGARLLRRWLLAPLTDRAAIEARLGAVAALSADADLPEVLAARLALLGDMERLAGKLSASRISPRELAALGRALALLPEMTTLIDRALDAIGQPCAAGDEDSPAVSRLTELAQGMDPCLDFCQQLSRTLAPNPGIAPGSGTVIAEGVSAELDEYRGIAQGGREYLQRLQQQLAVQTGIPSLKIAYNKVFGYYLEVTNAHQDKVPDDWIRRQTLVGAERYITPELKEYEDKIARAQERITALELLLWQELIAAATGQLERIMLNGRLAAELDVYTSMARLAAEQDYCQPQMDEAPILDIEAGRHPVIERQLPPGEGYVPNDVRLDPAGEQIILITGPNMSGKSALLRQTALICLMAQCGSFVPARRARIGIVDKLFTRVGAQDNLSRGESTFMVEMTETASILNNLSPSSLVLMDEIGRGTSTYDGISIAWAIVEHLHGHPTRRPRTLFATHYHELAQLSAKLERVANYNVSVREMHDRVIFLRKLERGPAAASFGIHVAQMAGIPVTVIARASEVLAALEQDKDGGRLSERVRRVPKATQLSLFGSQNPLAEELYSELLTLDLNTITGLSALLKLAEWRARIPATATASEPQGGTAPTTQG